MISEENREELEKVIDNMCLLLQEADVPYQYQIAMKIANNADACAQKIVAQSIKDISNIESYSKDEIEEENGVTSYLKTQWIKYKNLIMGL